MADDQTAKIIGLGDNLLTDPKMIQDFSKETDTILKEAEELFKMDDIQLVLQELLQFEKKCRQAYDGNSTSRVVCFILSKLKERQEFEKVNEYVIFFNKKRGQLKKTIIDMVNLCKSWIPEITNKEQKLSLINTLCTATEGKIFVEIERSDIIKILSKIKEDEGNIEEAATILQEVQVETFISMGKREKTEYILEQMRLVLLRKDFIRCHVISRKIDPKLLNTEDFEDLKLKYYEYMIEYYINEENYSEVSKCFENRFHTKSVLNDPLKWIEELKCYIIFLVLSPFEEQQSKFINMVRMEKNRLKEIPVYERMVKDFINHDLIPWPLPYEVEIMQFHIFGDSKFPGGMNRWNLLKKKVMYHNIYVISICYSRISLKRMSELLNITVEESESLLSELVSNKSLVAKMDRLHGTIKFGQKNSSESLLNNWSKQINQILDLLDESSHLIQKQKMLHEAKLKRMQIENKNI